MRRITVLLMLLCYLPVCWSVEIDRKILKRAETATVRIAKCVLSKYPPKLNREQFKRQLHYFCGGARHPSVPYQPWWPMIFPAYTYTGILINKQGYIVTTYNAVAGSAAVIVFDGATDRAHQRPAKVVWASPGHHLAIIQVTGLRIAGTSSSSKNGPNDKRPLRYPLALAIPSLAKVRKGASVWSLGFPVRSDMGNKNFVSLEPRLGKGNIATVSEERKLTAKMQYTKIIDHTARLMQGNNGGPLIDACGRVVGVNLQAVSKKAVDETNFAVNIGHLVDYLRVARIQHVSVRKPCLTGVGKTRVETKTEKIDNPVTKAIIIGITLIIGVLSLVVLWLIVQNKRRPAGSYSELVRRELSRVIGRSPGEKHRGHAPVAGARPKASATTGVAGVGVQSSSGGAVQGYLVGYGNLANIAVKLTGQALIVGRDPGCDFQVDSKTVGRQHLRITWQHGQFMLEDLGSSNGTFLENGERLVVGQPQALQPGDKFYMATPDNMLRLIPQQP